ncbi:HD domain-containing phosphohydrolase [Oceanobacillus bengalensis]|uniref:HD domain-containing protein n=1 Tax=Oceanobacillus bengalensis TaxID=1435466 RepID=A0A494YZA0_9BACI|nr:HD domain-containing phosphohydrolase [Oceanobacillus bengalensis]RKQ15559.1 HD domain-containing protein [Oceanobacillus bengalensis]
MHINTNDPERLTQISLTGITEESLARIHEYANILMPFSRPIVDQLYDEIYKVEHLKKIIDDNSNLERLKIRQVNYLKSIFSPNIDESYIHYRYLIGNVHSKIGLELPWFISTNRRYIQIITDHLTGLIPSDEVLPLIQAIDSLLNFDMQITADAYNQMEINKAAYPLQYEFKQLQRKSGIIDTDFEKLDSFSGLFTFHLDEIIYNYRSALMKRSQNAQLLPFVESYLAYLHNFLKQFFQNKMYRDEASFYRTIRDWTRKLIDQNISEELIISFVDTLNETTRETFFKKKENMDKSITDLLNAFERFTRFTLAILRKLLRPYYSLNVSSFLDIYSYEISMIDFGIITWMDDNTKRALEARGQTDKDMTNKRCYELFYGRVLPCNGCPARDLKREAILTSSDHEEKPTYYKTWRLPQSKLSEFTHRLLVSQNVSKETKVMFDTVESLLHLAEYRDDDTGEHVNRIGLFAGKLAEIAGCDEKFVRDIRIAAKFHDIGKVGIPDSILNKPGKLSSEEWESMKTHVNIGHKILSNLELPVIQMAAQIAKTHHERWNGCGYPNHLKGDEIPLEGRIVSIVDVFDALLSKRSYKEAFPPEKVKAIIMEDNGKHFDPKLTDLLLSVWDEFVSLYKYCIETNNIHYA